MSKPKKFSFKAFCKDANISQETVDILTKERLDDEFTLVRVDFDTLQSLELVSGDIYRLEHAIDVLFKSDDTRKLKSKAATDASYGGRKPSGVGGADGGADGGAGGTGDNDEVESLGCVKDLKELQEEVERTRRRSTSVPVTPHFPSPPVDDFSSPCNYKLPNATSLRNDERVSALLAHILGSDDIQGVSNLLSLSSVRLRSTVDTGKKSGEKPLLIENFLSSNYNTRYTNSGSQEEKISLNSDVKIVIAKDFRKPKVSEYTPELWLAANSRILIYLLQNGYTKRTILEYSDYSAVIGDFLGMYDHDGVFLFDDHHRKRVAIEGRAWNDICSHDESSFLRIKKSLQKVESDPVPENTPVEKKSKPKAKTNVRRKVVLDEEGKSICWNYNSKKSCDAKPCKHSHVCISCFGKHSVLDCKHS